MIKIDFIIFKILHYNQDMIRLQRGQGGPSALRIGVPFHTNVPFQSRYGPLKTTMGKNGAPKFKVPSIPFSLIEGSVKRGYSVTAHCLSLEIPGYDTRTRANVFFFFFSANYFAVMSKTDLEKHAVVSAVLYAHTPTFCFPPSRTTVIL